ncbi:MAG: cupin-like domain-containing protein [Burkholderiales bacterium]|nr:cupin-like domain-containing protein [Burkholderiales bacterium]
MPATTVKTWHTPSLATFQNDIQPLQQPAILRGLVAHWPAVRLASQGPEAICAYLMRLDNGNGVDAILLAPQEKGRVFYNDEMTGFNFARKSMPISSVIEALVRYSHFAQYPAIAVQSAKIHDCLPGFLREHPHPLLGSDIAPRIWIGNQIVTPAHFDESLNIACVVAGRRRFTLFPPEQVKNLYIGPLDFAPTPTPISMASLVEPDFTRYPRLREALDYAQVAELEPGDALYIPTLWWHHVESLDFFNVLVNYWWQDKAEAMAGTEQTTETAFQSLVHCVQHMQNLSPLEKRGWQAMFAHYLFNSECDPAAHIPPDKRGVLAKKRV